MLSREAFALPVLRNALTITQVPSRLLGSHREMGFEEIQRSHETLQATSPRSGELYWYCKVPPQEHAPRGDAGQATFEYCLLGPFRTPSTPGAEPADDIFLAGPEAAGRVQRGAFGVVGDPI